MLLNSFRKVKHDTYYTFSSIWTCQPVSKCERLNLKGGNVIPYLMTHVVVGECFYKPSHRSSPEREGQYLCVLM